MSNYQNIPFGSFSGFALTGAKKKGDKIIMGLQFNVHDNQSKLLKLTMTQHILDDLIYPEIINRVKENSGRPTLPLLFAHVMMFSDEKKNRIFINDEVKIKARSELQKSQNPGEAVILGNINNILSLYPQEKVDKNAANIMLAKLKGKWYFAADLIYDREKVGQLFDLAHEFFNSSKIAMKEEWWGPFITSLYDVTELSVKSSLLLTFYGKYSIHQTHEQTLKLFKEFCTQGNLDIKFYKHYQLLHSLKGKARYLNNMQGKIFKIRKENAEEYLEVTKELINSIKTKLKNIDSTRSHKPGEYITLGMSNH